MIYGQMDALSACLADVVTTGWLAVASISGFVAVAVLTVAVARALCRPRL